MKVNVQDAKVIVNSRTGSVVMNRHVSLDACAVAHGSLTVEVMQNNIISQPDTPFGGGETVVVPQTDISVRDSGGSLQHVRSSTDLNAVIRALNSGRHAKRADVGPAGDEKRRLSAGEAGGELMNAFDKFDQPAFDVRSLDTLKREAGRQSPGALKAAAKQMEGFSCR